VFRDPAWVADLAENLAGEYFAASDAMDAWAAANGTTPMSPVAPEELPDTVPEPWREVFAAISGGRSYVLEDALFSMMAHITYDLPVAMRRMAATSDVASHIADFHQMNNVLGLAIDFVQDDLASRYCWWLADLDRIVARNDELLSNYGIRVSRGMAGSTSPGSQTQRRSRTPNDPSAQAPAHSSSRSGNLTGGRCVWPRAPAGCWCPSDDAGPRPGPPRERLGSRARGNGRGRPGRARACTLPNACSPARTSQR
jgi:hypothetical protein